MSEPTMDSGEEQLALRTEKKDPPRSQWTPPLFDWALQTLPAWLRESDRREIDGLRLDWERRCISSLEECREERRVQVLYLLARREWHSQLVDRVATLRDGLLDACSLGECCELARSALESGQLRVVEQEDIESGSRASVLLEERDEVLRIRARLQEKLAGEEGERREEGQRLRRRLARLAARLRNQADEAMLACRLERMFGRRSVSLFSRFTFFCLLLLLALLLADFFIPKGTVWDSWLLWADTGICFVFLWEFVVRLACAPRRMHWFSRHLVTDFVPALPFGLLIATGPVSAGAGSWEFWVRSVRLVRFPIYARYVRFLKPLVATFRIVIFWVRGMDRIVLGMAPLLNRQIILFEPEADDPDKEKRTQAPEEGLEHRITHAFERLSHEMRLEAAPGLLRTLSKELSLYPERIPEPAGGGLEMHDETLQVTRAEDLIETLENLKAEEVEKALPEETMSSLGRLLGLADIPPLCWLPFVGKVVRAGKGATAANRIAHAGRALAGYCNRALGLVAAWADLAGVLTAPQILDRIATALMKSTQRPAVRLLLFGGLFVLIKLLFEFVLSEDLDKFWFGRFLDKFVATPLLVLGTVCLVLLMVARWMKKLAGQASDRLLRTAEARFSNLLELQRRRNESEDLEMLVRRVTCDRPNWAATLDSQIRLAMDELRMRVPENREISTAARKLALLLLDAQDGAFLHRTDTKGAEQFLSHPDLWSLRHEHLAVPEKEARALEKLDLEHGGLFSGPYIWFDMLTHALALKVARLTSTYNLHLNPKSARDRASAEELARHVSLVEGTGSLKAEPGGGLCFRGCYFHVLHFMSINPVWQREIERDFGEEVFQRLLQDRRRLIRELFGTRALHRLPREQRWVNPLGFYESKIGGGRILLFPFRVFLAGLELSWVCARLALKSLREILDPRIKPADIVDSKAPFTVARRKLRRMKKPLLHEAIRLAARVDPSYLGLGESGEDLEASEARGANWWQDLELVSPTPGERERIERVRRVASERLLYFRGFLTELEGAPAPGTPERRRLLASFAMDERKLCSLAVADQRARAWLHAVNRDAGVPPGALPSDGAHVPPSFLRRGLKRMLARLGTVSRRERRRLKDAIREGAGDIRLVCLAFAVAMPRWPSEAAADLAEKLCIDSRDFLARRNTLRAVVGLIVQDLEHHESLV
ncbi:MAG: hypothetical protein ACE5F1_05650, partial [Planctomycetota bacterium]